MPNEDPPDGPSFSTGDLARLTGNTLRTVRYYEEQGLLHPVPRSSGEHRLFTQKDLDCLRTISDLRAVGLSLEEISQVIKLRVHAPEGAVLVEGARKMLEQQLAVVEERLATLQRVRTELEGARSLLAECCQCPDLGRPKACGTCDHAQEHLPKSLVSLLLQRPQSRPTN